MSISIQSSTLDVADHSLSSFAQAFSADKILPAPRQPQSPIRSENVSVPHVSVRLLFNFCTHLRQDEVAD